MNLLAPVIGPIAGPIAGLLLAIAAVSPVTAQIMPQDVGVTTDATSASKSSRDLVVLPIPISNPTIGSGLAIAGALLYRLDPLSDPSYTGVAVFKTGNGSKGGGVKQVLNFDANKWRLDITGGYADVNYDFYGVGAAGRLLNQGLPISQRGYMLLPKAYIRVADHLWAGLQYRRLDTKTSIGDVHPNNAILAELLKTEVKVVTAGAGPVLQFDTRDSTMAPTKGMFIDAQMMVARKSLGGDFDYETYQVAFNYFQPLSPKLVLAARLFGCAVTGRAPFFDECSFGAQADLRGYAAGRYRDKTMLATQAELRWQVTERFGLVAFGGVGGVGSSLHDYGFRDLLTSLGGGIRYKVSKDYGVNVGIDGAVGKNSSAVYFRIGEAF